MGPVGPEGPVAPVDTSSSISQQPTDIGGYNSFEDYLNANPVEQPDNSALFSQPIQPTFDFSTPTFDTSSLDFSNMDFGGGGDFSF